MSTTRRSILGSLAALPTAAVSGLMGTAAEADASHPDAALIAYAAKVEALAARRNEALQRFGELDGKRDELEPPEPNRPNPPDVWDMDVERQPDGGVVLRQRRIVPDPALVLAAQQDAVAHAAWKAECAAIRERLGVDTALARHDEAADHLYGAVVELMDMTPTTYPGLAAKARVAVLLDPFGDNSLEEWEHQFWSVVLRDMASIGGAA